MAETPRDPKPRTTLKDLPETEREPKELTEQESDATKGGLLAREIDPEEDPLLP